MTYQMKVLATKITGALSGPMIFLILKTRSSVSNIKKKGKQVLCDLLTRITSNQRLVFKMFHKLA